MVKQGWNGGVEQCRRAAARFYGLGSCSQPPPPPGPSSFLRCTVVYTWATTNHVWWKKRGRTMKQWGCAERQCKPVTLEMWFATPTRSFSINLAHHQHSYSTLTSLCARDSSSICAILNAKEDALLNVLFWICLLVPALRNFLLYLCYI